VFSLPRATYLGAILVVLGPYQPVYAQEIPWRVNLDARAGLLLEMDRQRSEGSGTDRRFNRNRAAEWIGMDAQGWAFRPEVFRFQLGGDFGLRQEKYDISDLDRQSNRGDVVEYDALFDLFPDMLFAMSLFGNRFEDRAVQDFGADQEITGETIGATLRQQSRLFPFTLSRRRTQSIGKSLDDPRTRREEVRHLWEFSGSHISDFTRARLQFRDEDVDDRSVPALGDYRLREARGSLGKSWGDYLEHSFRTGMAFFRRTGNFDRDSFSSTSDYSWGMTDDLTADLHYEYDRFDSLTGTTDTQIADARLTHLWYDSFQSSLDVYTRRSAQSEGLQRTLGGSFASRYRKRFFTESLLLANFRYRREIADSDSSSIIVSGEELPAEDFTNNFLRNRNIDGSSIAVSDLDGNPLAEDIDYEVIKLGDETSIEILPGASVAPPTTLIVDYAYETTPDVRIRKTSLSYGTAWDHGWFLLRYEHGESDSKALDGEPLGILLDSHRDLYGMTLRRRDGPVRGSMILQFERERSQVVSRDEWSLAQNLFWQISPSLSFKASTRASNTELNKQGRTTKSLAGTAALRWRPGPDRMVRLYGRVRSLDDSLSEDQLQMLFGVEADFAYGRIEVRPAIRWSLRDRGSTRVTDLNTLLRIVWSLR
jgi:hypothetical protein